MSRAWFYRAIRSRLQTAAARVFGIHAFVGATSVTVVGCIRVMVGHALTDPDPLTMFDEVYAEPHPELERQRAEYADYLAGFDAGFDKLRVYHFMSLAHHTLALLPILVLLRIVEPKAASASEIVADLLNSLEENLQREGGYVPPEGPPRQPCTRRRRRKGRTPALPLALP